MGLVERNAARAQSHLEPGETIYAACICQPAGSMTAGALGGPIGALVFRRAKKAKHEETRGAGFPLASMMTLVVTDRRLLVLGSGKKLLGALQASDVAGAVVEQKNALSSWKIRIDLTNQAAVALEANRMMQPDRLVGAIQGLAARPESAFPSSPVAPPIGRHAMRDPGSLVRTRQLTHEEFKATMPDMVAVEPGSEPPFDFWPYFDSIPQADLVGRDCGSGEIGKVYRHAGGLWEHVLFDTDDRNVVMVLVLDLQDRTVLGHHLLDLNRHYGLSDEDA